MRGPGLVLAVVYLFYCHYCRCEMDYIDRDINLLPNSRNRLELVNSSWSKPWCFCAATIELFEQVLEQIEQRGWQSMKWKVGWDVLEFDFLSCRRDLRNVAFWSVLCLCRGGRAEGSHLNQLCASLRLLARMISPCFIGLPIMAKRTLLLPKNDAEKLMRSLSIWLLAGPVSLLA